MVRDDDINELLRRWQDTKQEIAELEKKCEKYKTAVDSIMHKNDTNSISSNEYTVTKRLMSRETLTKKDVPTELWARYAKEISYSAFYFKKKSKRSPKKKAK